MLGNVWEWCQDEPLRYTADAVVDPMGPTPVHGVRVFRGGGWNLSWRFVRAAIRNWFGQDYRSSSVGFRCASAGLSR